MCADLNLKAIESDLSFLARAIELQSPAYLDDHDRARLSVLASRYPRGGAYVRGVDGPSDDDAGTRSG